jgi:hypothetical protein
MGEAPARTTQRQRARWLEINNSVRAREQHLEGVRGWLESKPTTITKAAYDNFALSRNGQGASAIPLVTADAVTDALALPWGTVLAVARGDKALPIKGLEWGDARVVSVVVGSASARRGRGDRRGARADRGRRAESLRACASRWLVALDHELVAVTPAGSELGDAVEAIILAVRASVLRFGPTTIGPWERAVCPTGGLLSGEPRLPP